MDGVLKNKNQRLLLISHLHLWILYASLSGFRLISDSGFCCFLVFSSLCVRFVVSRIVPLLSAAGTEYYVERSTEYIYTRGYVEYYSPLSLGRLEMKKIFILFTYIH